MQVDYFIGYSFSEDIVSFIVYKINSWAGLLYYFLTSADLKSWFISLTYLKYCADI